MDPWIEIRIRLRRDPKLKRFCRSLDIKRTDGLGLVVDLWLWTAEQMIPGGNIGTLDHRDIAAEVEWPEDQAERLWDALTAKGPATATHPRGEPGFVDGGGSLHNWEEFRLAYELSRVKRDFNRDKTRKRVKRFRERRKMRNDGSNADVTPGNDPTRPDQTRPDQTLNSSAEGGEGGDASLSPEERIASYLRRLILRNDPKAKLPTEGSRAWESWVTEADRLLRIDGRGLDEAKSVLLWSQNDSFWRANILSLPKFRKKYTQLKLQRDRGLSNIGANGSGNAGESAPKEGDDRYGHLTRR